jgi:hypothetical protein
MCCHLTYMMCEFVTHTLVTVPHVRGYLSQKDIVAPFALKIACEDEWVALMRQVSDHG